MYFCAAETPGSTYGGFLASEQLKTKQVFKHNICRDLPDGNASMSFLKENHIHSQPQHEADKNQDNFTGLFFI